MKKQSILLATLFAVSSVCMADKSNWTYYQIKDEMDGSVENHATVTSEDDQLELILAYKPGSTIANIGLLKELSPIDFSLSDESCNVISYSLITCNMEIKFDSGPIENIIFDAAGSSHFVIGYAKPGQPNVHFQGHDSMLIRYYTRYGQHTTKFNLSGLDLNHKF